MNSGTNPRNLAERVNSGTNPGDLAERVNSGINFGDLAEKVNSGTNPGVLAEKVNSGSNSRDLVEKVNSSMNPEDLAEKVISSPRSGGASQGDPEANSLGVSSGPPSLVDVRVLRDLEVMKADHDLDMAVTEGSFAVIRGRYSIPTKYGLHAPRPGQRRYSSDEPSMCITVDALEANLWFPLHSLIEDRGGYYLTTRVGFRVSEAPSNNKGGKSHYLFVSGSVWGFRLDWSAHPISNASSYLSEEEFILVSRLKGILSSSCAIKEMTELWLVKAGLSPASRDWMELGDLRGMPKMSSGKAPSTRVTAPALEVGVSPAREAPTTSSKRPIDAPTKEVDDPAQSSRGDFSTPQLARELYTLPLKVLLAEAAKEMVLMALFDQVHAAGRLITFMDYRISQLQQELDALKLLKEAQVRARKMDDELLQAVKALENAQVELPRQAIDRYKESTGFKEGLKRMGRITYEYGYRVTLARFHALHPDSKV
ncbi:hypothetical protein B296_00037008 [Ensete ventricosum]|uniref:Uncharacterized protein n=1 Tax=Ensete ventricosum TaxID=4639 RepID=A0A426WW46_ENSVE|nr:hypothetical protein B296_00037008 [Ensete ventricosum]